MSKNVLVRYTGTRPGTQHYQVKGRTRRYQFGQNKNHYQAMVDVDDWSHLKRAFERELLEIPMHLHSQQMDLGCLIVISSLFTDSEKLALVRTGLATVGEALAMPDLVESVLPVGNNVLKRLNDFLFYRQEPSFVYETYAPVVEADDLTKIKSVGASTARNLNTLGYFTYNDVAERLTADEWKKLQGVSPKIYRAVVESAALLADTENEETGDFSTIT